MTKKDLASKLDGYEYLYGIPSELEQEAKDNNLVIIFGAAYDSLMFHGAVRNILDVFGDETIYIDKEEGLIENLCPYENCTYYIKKMTKSRKIKALWDKDAEYSWTFETDIPKEEFDVTKNGKLCCRGIVIDLKDL